MQGDRQTSSLFLVGGDTKGKKIHLVNWETICKDKMELGFGLKSSYFFNQAYFIKLGWRLLWVNHLYGTIYILLLKNGITSLLSTKMA